MFTLRASSAKYGGKGEAPRQALRGRECERSPPEVERLQQSGKKATPFSCKYDVAACKDG